MEDFDADKDGKLNKEELTKSLEEMRNRRPPDEKGFGSHPSPPPADKVAERMIQRFAADKKGLTQTELAKALAEHHRNRGNERGQ